MKVKDLVWRSALRSRAAGEVEDQSVPDDEIGHLDAGFKLTSINPPDRDDGARTAYVT